MIVNLSALSRRWPNLKPLTYQDAMDEMYAAEDAGLGHLSLNFPRLEEACNWCECCCRVVNPLIYAGLDYDLMDPTKSRYQASIDQTYVMLSDLYGKVHFRRGRDGQGSRRKEDEGSNKRKTVYGVWSLRLYLS